MRLSQEQSKILQQKGVFVVRAGPGSGKTFAAIELIKSILEEKSRKERIAAISFTNTAKSEICNGLDRQKVNYSSNFIGTIDSFLNKYVFLKYGHLIMECKNKPIIVGPPASTWSFPEVFGNHFTKFTLDKSNNVVPVESQKKEIAPFVLNDLSRMENIKRSLLKKGFATQKDATILTWRLLSNFPALAKNIALSFPYFIVDEAQDTTPLHMDILDILLKANFKVFCFIGDPDQSIYEWNGAKPQLFMEKFSKHKENSIAFVENYRSSQKICDFTYKLSTLPQPPLSKASVDCNTTMTPQIYSLSKSYSEHIIDFIDFCEAKKIEVSSEKVAVLCRGTSLIDEISGFDPKATPWFKNNQITKDILFCKIDYENKNLNIAIKEMAKLLFPINQDSHFTDKEILTTANQALTSLPSTDLSLEKWVEQASKCAFAKSFDLKLKVKKKYSKGIARDYSESESFEINGKKVTLSTIHKIKGRTFDAVLLILKKGYKKNYTTMLESSNVSTEEELRNVYVAITRPKRVLQICVPDENNENAWMKHFDLIDDDSSKEQS